MDYNCGMSRKAGSLGSLWLTGTKNIERIMGKHICGSNDLSIRLCFQIKRYLFPLMRVGVSTSLNWLSLGIRVNQEITAWMLPSRYKLDKLPFILDDTLLIYVHVLLKHCCKTCVVVFHWCNIAFSFPLICLSMLIWRLFLLKPQVVHEEDSV